MIPLVEQTKDLYQNLKVYENCYFGCGKSTKFWHCRTNQPICKECAKIHKVSEIEKCHPKYKSKTKRQYMDAFL
jgi:ABC-type sugar transport system ATPase subunit